MRRLRHSPSLIINGGFKTRIAKATINYSLERTVLEVNIVFIIVTRRPIRRAARAATAITGRAALRFTVIYRLITFLTVIIFNKS